MAPRVHSAGAAGGRKKVVDHRRSRPGAAWLAHTRLGPLDGLLPGAGPRPAGACPPDHRRQPCVRDPHGGAPRAPPKLVVHGLRRPHAMRAAGAGGSTLACDRLWQRRSGQDNPQGRGAVRRAVHRCQDPQRIEIHSLRASGASPPFRFTATRGSASGRQAEGLQGLVRRAHSQGV